MSKKVKQFLSALVLIIPTFTFANGGIDEKINSVFEPLVEVLATIFFFKPFGFLGFEMPMIVMWLIIGAVFFTIYLRFVNLRKAKHAIELIKGDFDDPDDKGEVSHFQALVTALSGTVGLGNIAGVAVAIATGGAGATFWMVFAGFFGMSAKYVGCTLGVKYREINEEGEVSGGPMYYLSKGLEKQGKGVLGKILAVVFAILCVGGSFGGGNMFQSNQSYAQLSNVFPVFEGYGFAYGIVIAILVGVVIIGGIKSIAKVTDKIVPVMVGVYVLACLIIIFVNFSNLGHAVSLILEGAFTGKGIQGGIIGVLVIGVQRAAFSNEAGVGSATIAHAAVKTDEPITEGVVAMLGPFIDTIVICTMTALVLIFTGFAEDTTGLTGAELTSAAFSSLFPWFRYVLLVAIVLFAFSTMISWSYYGLKAFTFLFKRFIGEKTSEIIYKVMFLFFVVVGSSSSLGAVMDFSDMMILGMALPNVLGLYFLVREVKDDTVDYFKRVASGKIKKFK
ncbi:sodium:alanine symporter family protein [Wenyingzhuangia sp. 2_MG-2023]|uniref:alanine/glycine:cation symporter family protein n=1 Tax=Wenyingzhuangia sp. 2_MG-2023 TaxID=3062639 RepID=UPI0026E4883F|nr:alanine/glycine:cation symporter family protein [Wenyingzhuangia sp. 2_MG-2023]MDO6737252.1 alanine/glycine:cation symporter family protein [Wenyingzhuangia sp. 2_MG-2023]MDO6801669.1 alanine/glycine:cation symporter family protein [Wenyingzhuangia sp. 1_MG-2023]